MQAAADQYGGEAAVTTVVGGGVSAMVLAVSAAVDNVEEDEIKGGR